MEFEGQKAHEADHIVACETCGLVQSVGVVPEGSVAHCARCRFKLFARQPDSRTRTMAFSLAALFLYFPSNIYPLITTEYHGLHSETTIFQGIKALFTHEQYFIGSLVFCTSILSPALKIIGLLFIPLTVGRPALEAAAHLGLQNHPGHRSLEHARSVFAGDCGVHDRNGPRGHRPPGRRRLFLCRRGGAHVDGHLEF